MKRVEQYAREKGYVTGIASDLCSLVENEYTKGFGGAKFPDSNPLDHELFQVSCDYHNNPLDGSLFFIGRGPYSASKNCYMGRDLATPHLEYALDFFRTYKKERKYFTVRFIDPHEFTGELNNFIYPLVANFLETMEK